LIGYFRAFPYRVALFPWIRNGLYIQCSRKNQIQQHEPRGARFKIISTEPTFNWDDDAKL